MTSILEATHFVMRNIQDVHFLHTRRKTILTRVIVHTSKLTHCHIKHYEWTDYSCDINTAHSTSNKSAGVCACVRRMHSHSGAHKNTAAPDNS